MRTPNFGKLMHPPAALLAATVIAATIVPGLDASSAYAGASRDSANASGGAISIGAATAPSEAQAPAAVAGQGEPLVPHAAPGASHVSLAEEEAALDGVSFATWYGPGLLGHHTACGQLLTKRTIGVANRTLPCGTLVEVTYGGRHRTIPVIDRGPYGSLGANWDLTEGAARLLRISESVDIETKVVGHVENTPELGRAASVRRRRQRRAHGATGGASA
ncbi:MAG: septal ring lytic transglycosylase RlpA family protein [Solirubrobacteraceae bacterium]